MLKKSETLFQLIKSLSRNEKRYFKLHASQMANSDDLKYLKLFEMIDKQQVYDQGAILSQEKSFKKEQFSNLKAHLYSRILETLVQANTSKIPEIRIRELINTVQVLYNKGLYFQCADNLRKAKRLAQKYDHLELMLMVSKWEKTIMQYTVGRENPIVVNEVIKEVKETNDKINLINQLSNLSVMLNALYQKTGYIRNELEYSKIQEIFNREMPLLREETLSINENFQLYELYVGYYFFIQDFTRAYEYAEKWVGIFDQNPNLIKTRVEMYIQALNSLMIAQYKLNYYSPFIHTKRKLKLIRTLPIIMNENIERKLVKYTYVHEFNGYFMKGEFSKGVALINRVKPALETFIATLDNHSKVILYYKLACLYFGSSRHSDSIFWLNKIFNEQDTDLRQDIHSFAKIMHLISHYEIGNYEVIDYYIRSTYRFLLKKEDLHKFQLAILSFIKKLGSYIRNDELQNSFSELLIQLKELENNEYERRAFIYFDIISWLESKIYEKSIEEIIQEKSDQRIEKSKISP